MHRNMLCALNRCLTKVSKLEMAQKCTRQWCDQPRLVTDRNMPVSFQYLLLGFTRSFRINLIICYVSMDRVAILAMTFMEPNVRTSFWSRLLSPTDLSPYGPHRHWIVVTGIRAHPIWVSANHLEQLQRTHKYNRPITTKL